MFYWSDFVASVENVANISMRICTLFLYSHISGLYLYLGRCGRPSLHASAQKYVHQYTAKQLRYLPRHAPAS